MTLRGQLAIGQLDGLVVTVVPNHVGVKFGVPTVILAVVSITVY